MKNRSKNNRKLFTAYRVLKEFFRISRITIAPIPGKMLAKNWLRLQFARNKNARPFSGRIGNVTLCAASYYDFVELFDEVFLVNTYFIKLTEPEPIIFDCGANCGFVTAYFKMLYPDARLSAFEPNPVIFPLLKKNIEMNKWTDVVAIDAACGKENCEIEFFLDESYSLASSIHSTLSTPKTGVRQIALADFIMEEISLIKMDIEGAEMDVLTNLAKTGKIRFVKRFAIEYHHRLFDEKSKLADFLRILEGNGFDYNFFAYRTQPDFYSTRWQSMMIYAFRK